MTALTLDFAKVNFEKGNGLVTVVTQSARSGEVLMVAFADREALEKTVQTGVMHYRSRTRGLWKKGETSGNVQNVVSLELDCDGDAVLARVDAAGPACHNGTTSCFPETSVGDALGVLDRTIAARAKSAPGEQPSYTQKLLGNRNLRLKKMGEEAAELVLACADKDRERIAEEVADLVYHALVAARAEGVSLDEVRKVLEARARK